LTVNLSTTIRKKRIYKPLTKEQRIRANEKQNERRKGIKQKKYTSEEHRKTYAHKYYLMQKEKDIFKLRELNIKRSKKRIDVISDSYVKKIINDASGIKTSLISNEMIDAKREHIKVIRQLKEMINENFN